MKDTPTPFNYMPVYIFCHVKFVSNNESILSNIAPDNVIVVRYYKRSTIIDTLHQ